MYKKIISGMLSAMFTFACMGIVSAEQSSTKIYVAPNGNDSADGSIEHPLKTIEEAQKKVQQIKNADTTVEVILRGGEYRLNSGISFNDADGGTKEHPVVYKAYDGEKVSIKGSVELNMSKASRVTNPDVLSKLRPSVKNKLVEVDLQQQGISPAQIKKYTEHHSEHSLSGGEVNGLFMNGMAETVAEWPNGFGNYTTWDYALSGNTMHYTDTRPNYWENAKYMWIGGYNQIDFQYVRRTVTSVNPENSTIICDGDNCSFTSPQSRRWKAFNLIEEIDLPGEYYIDPDTLKLYWYPETGIYDAKVEFATLLSPMFNLSETENVRFENLEFAQTNSSAVTMRQVKNVDFVGCKFKNIGTRGIYIYSNLKADTDRDYWQRNDIDGSYDCDILACEFDNIGHNAINVNAGNVDTLTKGNNRIENNIITKASQLARNAPAVYISGCGVTVKNNNISNLPFHAINVWGNDHTINNNEIYDCLQESDDCGAIYQGRNTLHRGTEIAYNFIHDYMPVKSLIYNFQGGIYLDDCIGGYSIHHNILKNGNVDLIVNGGVDINYSDNISVGIKNWHIRFINGGIVANANSDKGVWAGHISNEELYFSHYKNLRDLISRGKIKTKDPEMAKYNVVKNNLGVDTVESAIGTNTLTYGKVSGNVDIAECNDFVEPEKQDYRIKKDSQTYKETPGVLTNEYDMNQIGVQQDVKLDGETSSFVQLYPRNGQEGVNASSIEFKWQDAYGANIYKLVVATDKELQNVVHEGIYNYNVAAVDSLQPNKVYYWKVYAENISHDYGNKWESKSPVFALSTSMYETLETEFLYSAIENAQKTLDTLDVGTEPGQYPESMKKRVENIISISKIIANSRLGMVSQSNVDKMTNILSNSFNILGATNRGYIDLSKYFTKAENWNVPVDISQDGTVTVNKEISGRNNMGINNLQYLSGSVLYSFDARLDISSGYLILGQNKDNNVNPYAATNASYAFLFKPETLELHVMSGTSQNIVLTQNHSFANDNKFHKIQYGFIKTDIGNIVLLYVDGVNIVTYLDIINPAVKTMGTFMIHSSGGDNTITLRKTDDIGKTEELNNIIDDCLYKSAKEIITHYSSEDKIIVLQDNGSKIFNETGVYDTGNKPVSYINSVMVMPFDSVSKVFGFETERKDNELIIRNGEKNIVFEVGGNLCSVGSQIKDITQCAVKDGNVDMIPVETMLKEMNMAYTYSAENGLMIVGNIIFMNNINVINKTKTLMNLMKNMDYQNDYIFAEHE